MLSDRFLTCGKAALKAKIVPITQYLVNPMFSLFLLLAIVPSLLASVWCGRRGMGSVGFSLGGRKAGAGLVAGIISGSSIGGGATIGTAQMAYRHGIVAWCFTLGVGLGLLLLGRFFARPLRESGLETVPQYLVQCYGRAAGPIVSLLSCLGIFFACCSSVLPGIGMCAASFDISPSAAGGVLLALPLAYIIIGGQKGAGISGMIKAALLWSALLLASLYAARGLFLSPAESAAALPETAWSFASRGWHYPLSAVAAAAMGMMTAQMYIQALYSARDARAAERGAYLGAAIAIPVGLMSTLIGLYARAHHPELADTPLLALPCVLMNDIPAWLGGLAMGTIVLTIISSAAAQALAIGTLLSRDFGGELLHLRNEKLLLLLNRLGIILALGGVCAYCLAHLGASVLTWNYLSMSLRGGGILLPLLLAVLTRGRITAHIPRAWVLASMLLPTAATLLSACLSDTPPAALPLILSAATLAAGALSRRLMSR